MILPKAENLQLLMLCWGCDVHQPPRIVALDFANPTAALALADRLDPQQCAVKVGRGLFVSAGPEPVRRMVERGFNVFLDLKFHDIPNTVANACAAAVNLGVWMLNVHASGGRAMLRAARDAVDNGIRTGSAPPLLIGGPC
jgi:orotidine-5'-phosphate decarboxylase